MSQVEAGAPGTRPSRSRSSLILAGLTCLVLTLAGTYVVVFTHIWLLFKVPLAALTLLWGLMTWHALRRLLTGTRG